MILFHVDLRVTLYIAENLVLLYFQDVSFLPKYLFTAIRKIVRKEFWASECLILNTR